MKRIISAFLAAGVLVAWLTAATSPGSVSDPLISKSYIDDTFVPGAVKAASDEAAAALEGEYGNLIAESGLSDVGGYSFASGFAPLNLQKGDTVDLKLGSSVMLVSGAASISVTGGTVINISSGSSVTGSVSLSKNQRYFCAEDTYATVTASADSVILVNGDFRTDADVGISSRYTDVTRANWFYEYVEYVVNNGLYYDINDAAFRPNEAAARATLVYALWAAAGSPAPKAEATFKDVGSEWYASAVSWASENAIVLGYGDGTFRPGSSVTREEIAALIHRYAVYLKRNGNTRADVSGFGDSDQVANWALEDVRWAVGEKIFIGDDKNNLNPKGTATRAEVAAILMRVIEQG